MHCLRLSVTRSVTRHHLEIGLWYYYVYGVQVPSPEGSSICVLSAETAVMFVKRSSAKAGSPDKYSKVCLRVLGRIVLSHELGKIGYGLRLSLPFAFSIVNNGRAACETMLHT